MCERRRLRRQVERRGSRARRESVPPSNAGRHGRQVGARHGEPSEPRALPLLRLRRRHRAPLRRLGGTRLYVPPPGLRGALLRRLQDPTHRRPRPPLRTRRSRRSRRRRRPSRQTTRTLFFVFRLRSKEEEDKEAEADEDDFDGAVVRGRRPELPLGVVRRPVPQGTRLQSIEVPDLRHLVLLPLRGGRQGLWPLLPLRLQSLGARPHHQGPGPRQQGALQGL
mmetsp:Transcript_28984/g.93448  ORF Transcript_28984/g.93448 Transcript_28984/m.93448 type:complete len:223 (-) Transcript_28984:655-1323(-)